MPLQAPRRKLSAISRVYGVCNAAWLALAALGFAVVLATPVAAEVKPSFFDTTEQMSTNLSAFTKWNDALARYTKERAQSKAGPCGATELNKCNFEKWMDFLKTLKDKDLVSQIREVNDYMNRAPYVTDPVNWGQKDFWATPGEFMAKFGDCEDYAISKYISLRLLGYKEQDLRVVAVKDMNLKIGHAILVVFFKGKPYLLDNQIKQVIAADKVKHYTPVFSINASAWWKHQPI